MIAVSASSVAIALAHKAGTLRIFEREGRFGTHAVIVDHVGVIETPDTLAEANAIVAAILERIAK